ncbi:MAG: hypothetical protein ABR915_16335 [Thermoguttaceae bacterium]|jgi:deoxycytidine triphosphate deaminase
MFLSDRDLAWAIDTGRLIVEPRPGKIDATSLDLHLGKIEDAKIWDIEGFAKTQDTSGKSRPELHVGKYKFDIFAKEYTVRPPEYSDGADFLVMRRGSEDEEVKLWLDHSDFFFGRPSKRLEHPK